MKVLHYVGHKPWMTIALGSDQYAPLVELWTQFLTRQQLYRLFKIDRRDRWDGDAYAERIDAMARKLRKLRYRPYAFFRDAKAVRVLSRRLGIGRRGD